MMNKVIPAVNKKLRQMAGLSQDQLASALEISRMTVMRVEKGEAQYSAEQERRLRDLAKCSKEEYTEMLCEGLGDEIGRRVVIEREPGGREPTAAVSKARSLLRHQADRIPVEIARALNNKVHTSRLLGIAYERINADLRELTQDCLAVLQGDREPARMPSGAEQ